MSFGPGRVGRVGRAGLVNLIRMRFAKRKYEDRPEDSFLWGFRASRVLSDLYFYCFSLKNTSTLMFFRSMFLLFPSGNTVLFFWGHTSGRIFPGLWFSVVFSVVLEDYRDSRVFTIFRFSAFLCGPQRWSRLFNLYVFLIYQWTCDPCQKGGTERILRYIFFLAWIANFVTFFFVMVGDLRSPPKKGNREDS